MWEIYSVGDAAFLERILNALAMLAGTGNLEQVAGIGMMVGVIILGFQSILGGGDGIKFQNLLVSWIIYGMMFGTGARVAIEDVYSGQVRVVDNVPFGVAAAGSMVTQLGYGVTSLFEQAFGEAQMTEQGFAFALETLANLRKMSLSKANLGSANSPVSGDDIWQSWKNYIADCTMTGVNLKQYTVEDIQKSMRNGGTGGILEQLKFESQAYGTEVVLRGAANNGFYTCSDAFLVLSTHTNSNFVPALNRRAAEAFGVPADEVADRVQHAFQAIEQSQIDAQNYMLTTAMAPIFDWAMVDNDVNFQRVSTAAMLHSAIQQRNEQWGAEQALFNTVVRPMMTFFEGLVFAITPMMAFLIGLGPMGIGLMGKYLMILLWIQLWMPVLAIINLYLHMAVGKKMAALQNVGMGNMPLESFYGLQSMDQTLQTWISTGGMLAASVPAITLMLIYGGAVTASSVAGRMSSASVPTNLSTPPLASNSPLLERQSMRTSNEATGLGTTGAGGLSMTTSSGYSNALASSKEEVSAKQQAYASEVGQTIQSNFKTGEQFQDAVTSGLTKSGTNSEVFKASAAHGRDQLSGLSFTNKFSEGDFAQAGVTSQFGTGVNGKAGGSGTEGSSTGSSKLNADGSRSTSSKGGKMDLGAGIDAKASGNFATQMGQKYGLSADQQKELSERLSSNTGRSTETGAALVTAVAKENKSGATNTFANELGLTDNSALKASASDVASTSDKFSANNQLQRSMGIVNQMPDNKIAGELRQRGLDSDVQQFMRNYGNQGGLNSEAGSLYDTIKGKNTGMRPEDATLAAQTLAIANGRFLDNIQDPAVRESVAIQGAQLMSRIAGIDAPNQLAHGQNQGVGSDAAAAAGVKDQVKSNVSGPGATAAGIKSEFNQGKAGVEESIAARSPDGQFAAGRKDVMQKSGEYEGLQNDERTAHLNERVNGAAASNARAIATAGVSESITHGLTPATLKEHGAGHAFSGSSNLDGYLDRAGITTGQSREAFMDMGPAGREREAAETYEDLARQFQRDGMHPDAAGYAASLVLPEALTRKYSDGGGFFNGGPQEQEVRAAAFAASHNERQSAHDTLYEGLVGATGDSGTANVAMQDIATSSVAMMNLQSVEGARLGTELTDRTLDSVGYGGNAGGDSGAWYQSRSEQPSTSDSSLADYAPAPAAASSAPLNPMIR